MKTKAAKAAQAASPYTGKNVDEAITHLERVLALRDATTVLGPDYWRARVTQIATSHGLTPGQRARVARLPYLLDSVRNPGFVGCLAASYPDSSVQPVASFRAT